MKKRDLKKRSGSNQPKTPTLLVEVLEVVMIPANAHIRVQFIEWMKRVLWLHIARKLVIDRQTAGKIEELLPIIRQQDMQSESGKPIDTPSNIALGELVELMVNAKIVSIDEIHMLIQQIIHDIKVKIGNERPRSKAKIRSKRKVKVKKTKAKRSARRKKTDLNVLCRIGRTF